MPRIVVVGGGYAGTLVAQQLDGDAEVVLVDPRDAFVNVAASLRALTQPDWAHHAFFPYADLLERGRVVRGTVVSVDPQGVEVAGGHRIEATHVVLATGSSYPYPAHPLTPDRSSTQALEDLRATHDQLAASTRVLVVGAGPVGLELAGEIREVWPDKPVTVVAQGDRLLPAYRPELHQSLVDQLAALDVDLRLGVGLLRLPTTAPGLRSPFSVATTAGDEIVADLWFRGFGSRVQTDYLRDGRLVTLTDRGRVPVTPTLAVVGAPNVYAVGDIADLADPAMATHAQTQAATVIENLRAQVRGRVADAVYVPASSQRIFLPLGTYGGVGQVPGPDGRPLVAPLEVVQERKGKDLFTAQLGRRFRGRGARPVEV